MCVWGLRVFLWLLLGECLPEQRSITEPFHLNHLGPGERRERVELVYFAISTENTQHFCVCLHVCLKVCVCVFVSRYCTCNYLYILCCMCVRECVCLYVPFCTRCYKLSLCVCVCLCTFVWVLPNIRGFFLIIGELQMKGAYESHWHSQTHTQAAALTFPPWPLNFSCHYRPNLSAHLLHSITEVDTLQ